jgi:putative transposase
MPAHTRNSRQVSWRRLKGENQLPKVIEGVTFKDGVEVTTADTQDAA